MKKLFLALFAWLLLYGMAFAAVNINTATQEELQSLKEIGPVRAKAIIDYRKQNGPFKSVDDLEKVKGIGPGIMKQIRSNVSVTGSTVVDKPAAETSKTKPKAEDSTKSAKATEPDKPKGDAKTSEKKSDGKVATTDKKPDKTADEKKSDKTAH